MDPGTGSSPHHRQLTGGKVTGSAGCAERRTPGAGGGRGKRPAETQAPRPWAYLAGGRRGGREQPQRSRAGSALPDGPGAVSETGRYTRGTGCVTPLDLWTSSNLVDRAGVRCVPALHDGRGTPGWVSWAFLGGQGESPRSSRWRGRRGRAGCLIRRPDDGQRGTHPRAFRARLPARGPGGIGATPAEGAGGAEPP